MTPTFFYLLIFFISLVVFGGFMIYRTWKKSRLVKCSYCDGVMDQDDFKIHAQQHIQSTDTKTKLITFKSWLLKELEKDVTIDEERLVREGSIVSGLSTNTIRPVLKMILEHYSKGDQI